MQPEAPNVVTAIAFLSGKSLRQYLEEAPQHGSTTDAITDALREAILDGSLPPSTWLREDDLARQMRVSRTPVREALRRLTDEHLTVRAAHRGTIVASMGLDDVLAVFAVSETLEGLAARMTAARQPAGIVDELLAAQRRMAVAIDNDRYAEARLANLDFHRALRNGSGNAYLQRFLTQVEHAVRRFTTTTYETPEQAIAALAEHQKIIQAVAAGDVELAGTCASEHMRHAREFRVMRISAM